MADDGGDDYRPLSGRRRVLIALLALATAVSVALTLLDPPGGVKRKRHLPPDAAVCAPGQVNDCVGGKAQVIVVQPVPASRAAPD
jgi:hypothetical protein